MVAVTRRQTEQKAAVRAALAASPDFISAQDLYARLRKSGSTVGLATVYRNLNDLSESGDADVLQGGGGQLYRFCGGEHHHHLICVDCGRTVEVEVPVEEWVRIVTTEQGFTPVRHVLDIYGRCSVCQLKLNQP
jgi:Fur family ferric uptake transcriptional regulator